MAYSGLPAARAKNTAKEPTLNANTPAQSQTGTKRKTGTPATSPIAQALSSSTEAGQQEAVLGRILSSLDDDKAEDVVSIDLHGRSSLCDALVVASGRSTRHVASIATNLARRLKEAGYGAPSIEGLSQGDWVLVDTGDVVVHLFRPEVRAYYDLEGMWSVGEPSQA